jgi:arylsulfatase A-like enzyme
MFDLPFASDSQPRLRAGRVLLYALAACVTCTSCMPSSHYPAKAATHRRPDLDLSPAGTPAWRALDHLTEGTFELPKEKRFASREPASDIPLERGWRKVRSRDDYSLWRHEVPVNIPGKRHHTTPPGTRVLDGDHDLPFLPSIDRSGLWDEGWGLVANDLFVITKDPVNGGAFRLIHQGPENQQSRFSLLDSGLSEADFSKLDVTVADETRPSLFLPAPASATFTLTLPSKPVLRFATAIRAAVSVDQPRSKGLTFEIRIDGSKVWSSRQTPDRPFQDAAVSLDAWAGQKVSLSFVTEDGSSAANDLGVFAAPIVSNMATGDVRRVVVVGIDTLRPDHLGTNGYTRPTSPELDALSRESYVFDRARAPAPRTMPSFRTAFTGRYPLAALEGTNVAEVLSKAGFTTAGFSGNIHLVPRFGFSAGFDYWHYDNGAKADDQVDRGLAWLGRHEDQDAFLFLHIMDPHIYYDAPLGYKNLFVDEKPEHELPPFFTRWDILRMTRQGQIGDSEKRFIEARYDGEVRYMSHELGRLFASLDALPGRTLIVLHTDHGEEFWDHGGFEHNHTLFDELLHVALWFRPPGGWGEGPHHVSDLVSLLDLAPTIYDVVDVPHDDWPVMDGVSLRPFLDPEQSARVPALESTLADRPLHAGYLMYDAERWAVFYHMGKYILHTTSGEEELYDLGSDPGETHNLAASDVAELAAWRERLARATGWPVELGLRIELKTGQSGETTLHFPKPFREVGIIDPEAGIKNRANLEWGDEPRIRPEEVAKLAPGDDRLSVRIEANQGQPGTLYVLFDGDLPESTDVEIAGQTSAMAADGGTFHSGGRYMKSEVGPVIVPRETFGSALETVRADDGAMAALKALGYVE